MLSNHLILCHILLLLPSVFPSIRVFYRELALLIKWPKDWSFSSSPSNEYSGLISFKIDWFDLLIVQGTLKSLRQHYNSKASILQCLDFFRIQHSRWYMTTEKYVALTIWTFAGKVTSLLLIILSRFLIDFLPMSQGSFHFMVTINIHSDFGAQVKKICHCFHFFPFYLPWSDGTGCHDLCFLNVTF